MATGSGRMPTASTRSESEDRCLDGIRRQAGKVVGVYAPGLPICSPQTSPPRSGGVANSSGSKWCALISSQERCSLPVRESADVRGVTPTTLSVAQQAGAVPACSHVCRGRGRRPSPERSRRRFRAEHRRRVDPSSPLEFGRIGATTTRGEPALPSLPTSVRSYLVRVETDIRKSIDGLAATTNSVLSHVPLSGRMFVSSNRRRDRIEILPLLRMDVRWERELGSPVLADLVTIHRPRSSADRDEWQVIDKDLTRESDVGLVWSRLPVGTHEVAVSAAQHARGSSWLGSTAVTVLEG